MKIKLGLLFVYLATLAASQYSFAADFYVSPNGNDQLSGSRDEPLKSLEEARNRIRKLKKNNKSTGPSKIYLRGGRYYLKESFSMGAPDSNAVDRPIIIEGFSGEFPELLGSEYFSREKIHEIEADSYSKFGQLKDANLHVYYIDLEGGEFSKGKNDKRGQFYPFILGVKYNGEALKISSWPEIGWGRIDKNYNQTADLSYFEYEDSFTARQDDYANMFLHGYFEQNWADEYLYLKSTDAGLRRIYVENPNSYRIKFTKGQRWRAINIRSLMDDQGEYYIDYVAKRIYFILRQIDESSFVEVGVLSDPLILIKNSSNIAFKNIKFGNTLGDGVLVENSQGIVFENCEFTDINSNGIQISGGNDNKLIGSKIHRIGATAVSVQGGDRVKLQSANHQVINNVIYDFGLIRNAYAPAVSVGGVGISVTGNTIFNGPHAAILLSGNNHIVAKNDISNVVRETSDAGMIYIGRDWTMRGHLIADNFLHDSVSSMGGDVNAIYLDDLSSGITVSKNVVDNVARGVLIGGGRDNIIDENIFLSTEKPVWFDARGLNAKYELITKSPKGDSWDLFSKLKAVGFNGAIYSAEYPKLARMLDEEPLAPRGNVISNNYYDGNHGFNNGNAPVNDSWYFLKNNIKLKENGSASELYGRKANWFALARYFDRRGSVK